jgi:hypothetical protein
MRTGNLRRRLLQAPKSKYDLWQATPRLPGLLIDKLADNRRFGQRVLKINTLLK